MADKSISELVAATAVGSTDLFVLEQSGAAKKLPAQVLENWLVSFADGHGGISSWSYTPPVAPSLEGTLTLILADTSSIVVPIMNGAKGDTGAQTFVWLKWAAQNPTADNQLSDTPDAWIGIYTGTASSAPTSRTAYRWYQYKGETGAPGYAIDDVVWHENSGGGNVPGVPGTIDTYYMYLDDPNATYAGQFSVYNGADGEGSPGSQTPLSDSGSGAVGSASAYAREDHRHPLNVATTGTPSADGTASLGNASTYARTNHVHPLNVDTTNPAALGTASPGSASAYARRDHVHPMPSASDIGIAANQIRAIKIGTAVPTTSDIADGEIYLKYTV